MKEKLDFELCAKDDKADKIVLCLERDRTITSNAIETGPNKSKKMIPFFSCLGRPHKAMQQVIHDFEEDTLGTW